MKNIYAFLAFFVFFTWSCENSISDDIPINNVQKSKNAKEKCTTIQSKSIYYPEGHYLGGLPIETKFDIFGYNYQAHIFNGNYANLYIGEIDFPPYQGEDETYLIENPEIKNNEFFMTNYWPFRNVEVNMTWNDTWLSNKDCNQDGSLDTFQNTIGSGAWENYHSKGSYEDENGNLCKWNQHFKIVAIPNGATNVDDIWFDAEGNEIGQNFHGSWAIIQTIFNDGCGESNGSMYQSPFRVGFGNR